MAKKKKPAAVAKIDAEKNLAFGMCAVCLCTDEDPCPEGCGWADGSHSLCTACEDLTPAERIEKRLEAMSDLEMRFHEVMEELEVVRWRFAVAQRQPDVAGA